MPKGNHRCSRCGIRHVQEIGMCLRCSRESGQFVSGLRVKMRKAHTETLRPAPIVIPARTVTIRHRDYDIVWDGSIRPVVDSAGI